jgi:predicted phosphoribosyltransferase
MFKNRKEAGELLANKLIEYSNNKNVIVVAIPRGAVILGAIIAKKLNTPLEIVLSKKIGHPLNKEYAIGAVTLKSVVLNDDLIGISSTYIEEETQRIRMLLKKRLQWYYDEKEPLNFNSKTILLVDDGAATGSTLLSSIKLIHQEKPAEIIVALPVASNSAYKKIKKSPCIHRFVCLLVPGNFNSVGQFYENFSQVSDLKVIEWLKKAAKSYSINPLNT